MWLLILVFLAGPLQGDEYTYREPGSPVAKRFESFEACRAKGLEEWPALQKMVADSPTGDQHSFGLKCVPDTKSAST